MSTYFHNDRQQRSMTSTSTKDHMMISSKINGYEIKPGAVLFEADLSGTDLSWANLHRANLVRANLSGTDLSEADLSWAVLLRADLRGANLSGTDFSGTDLRGADLRGADLRGAKGIIDGGQDSRGYRFFAVRYNGGIMIGAGCRWFTAQEAINHWSLPGKPTNQESLTRAKALVEVARGRGWMV